MSINLKFPIAQEVEEGNIEYKLCLKKYDFDVLNKIASQLSWRLEEGKLDTGIAEAIYYMGVKDDGTIGNQSLESIKKSIDIIGIASKKCYANIYSVDIQKIMDSYIGIVRLRKFKDTIVAKDTRVIMMGQFNSGKTTLLSVLTYSQLDDGDGCARRNIFKYNHEVNSGETSSIKYEIMGYKDEKEITYSNDLIHSWEDIVLKSDKLISFIDLPGKNKFKKTIYFGLLASRTDYALVVLNSLDVVKKWEKTILLIERYTYLCDGLKIPYMYIFSNFDILSITQQKIFMYNLNTLCNLNTSKKEKKIINKYTKLSYNFKNIYVPMLPISNVTGLNLDILKKYLYNMEREKTIQTTNMGIFMINDIFYLRDIGTVVSGVTIDGIINTEDNLLIGPIGRKFYNVKIESIHKKQTPCKSIKIDENGTIFIKIDKIPRKKKITKNMMIIHKSLLKYFVEEIYVKIQIEINIKKNTIGTLYTGNIVEDIIIINIINNNDTKLICCKFLMKNIIRFIKNDFGVIINLKNNKIIIGSIVNYVK